MKNKKIIIAIALIVIGSSCLVASYLGRKKNNQIYEEVQEQVKVEKVENEEKEEENLIPIDFAALKETNEDIYAWIDIEDTNVHYPIVQSATDDAYYLDHTIEGVKGYPGSIYTESVNAKDFSDFNTVVYGHNMKDGSMFKHLHKFEDGEFFAEHDKIMIYTEDAAKEYIVYAAVEYDDRHILHSFDFSLQEEREKFIQSLQENRWTKKQYRDGVEINAESNLITLSTCTGNSSTRFIVVGVEVK